MDFTKLREQALTYGVDEEAVTVNTRALIDKVLARYSGEWTTLRELLQNAADAQARTVKIKFETLPSTSVPLPPSASQSELLKHTLLHATLRRLLVSNDGLVFGESDWARLKRIAEGNPNEEKIGAFGVGFYSVFADCEEPFVSSGKKAMAFYWKKDSLFTRQIVVPDGTSDTNFVLDYRNSTTPVPSLVSLCQFLATSLTFVALQNIELWLGDWKIIFLKKVTSPSIPVSIPRDCDTTTKENMMKVQTLARESVQMSATFMNVVGWKPSASASIPTSSAFGETVYGRGGSQTSSLRGFFSRLTTPSTVQSLRDKKTSEEKAVQEKVLEDLTMTITANVFLSITTATIQTYVKQSFAAELERATKKPPPKVAKLALLTSSYDEVAASLDRQDKITKSINIFGSVLPGKANGGRIFIGFPTNQTTGNGAHLSAPSLIPTVEREAIDLNARWVRTWNMEMLRVAGIISRIAYGNEMAELGTKLQRCTEAQGRAGRLQKEDIAKYLPEAAHILTSFTFEESTPNAQISGIIEESFWTAYKKASIEMYSSRGVLPTTSVRLATEDLSGFVEGIPVLPEALAASKLVMKLKEYGLVTEITFGDVKKELSAKALTTEQLVSFINWAGKKAIARQVDIPTMNSLLDNAVATIGDDQGGIITLSSIKYFLQPKVIPPELPISPETIPFQFTKEASMQELQALGWDPLPVATWVRFIAGSSGSRNGLSQEQDITVSPKFSSQVLSVISKAWDPLDAVSKRAIIGVLSPLAVIPTKMGMKVPKESYFASVKLFEDIPTISGLHGVKEKFLGALGVRKTVDLETIFQRLLSPASGTDMSSAPKWNHVDLIVYLAGVREDIPVEDMRKLKEMPICAAEAGPPLHEASFGSAKRYRISELFEPKGDLRNLGLPIIQWTAKGGYKPHSAEGKFLTALGLRSVPTVAELITMMASTDLELQDRSRRYYINNFEVNGYGCYNMAAKNATFVPIDGNEKKLVAPSECFANEKSKLIGFELLRRDLVPHASKFGVAENPNLADATQYLIRNPPKTQRDARVLFGYFSSRTGEREFAQQYPKLRDALIVPTVPKQRSSNLMFPEKSEDVKLLAPSHVYIGKSDMYKDIFSFVDFGDDGNRFLLACGSSHEPTRSQVAAQLASEPARVLGIVGSHDKYLTLLRLLAMSKSDLKRDPHLWAQMKASRFLLATKEVSSAGEGHLLDANDDEDEGVVKQSVLQPAHNIVIVDDYSTYQLFKNDLYAAPQEEILEDFYIALGAQPIGEIEEHRTSIGHVLPGAQHLADQIQTKVLERAKVFLHNHNADQLKHRKNWLEDNLSVEYVNSITIRISLTGYPMTRSIKKTAILRPVKDSYTKKYMLQITKDVDYYDISQEIVKHLLKRPNNEAATLFESLLTSDLQGLKRRGFNVDRILRAQAAEARIAEDQRLKQLQEEQEHINKAQEERKRAQQQQQSVTRAPAPVPESPENNRMPGAFEHSPPTPQPARRNRGLFSNISRSLGFGDGHAQEQLNNFFGGGHNQAATHPPPQDDRRAMEQAPPLPYDGADPQTQRRPGETETVSPPAAIQQNLLNAVKSSRAHDSEGVFTPPTQNTIKEQATYCDAASGQDIQYIGDAANGMRIYTSRALSIPAEQFLTANIRVLNDFGRLLQDIGDVYGVPRQSISVFYDESGSTIAFNLGGSYFCNLRFFQQLHWEKVSRGEAESWWWVVLAHELAHNLVKPHGSEHSYYTEGFIAQYLPKMVVRMGRMEAQSRVGEKRSGGGSSV